MIDQEMRDQEGWACGNDCSKGGVFIFDFKDKNAYLHGYFLKAHSRNHGRLKDIMIKQNGDKLISKLILMFYKLNWLKDIDGIHVGDGDSYEFIEGEDAQNSKALIYELNYLTYGLHTIKVVHGSITNETLKTIGIHGIWFLDNNNYGSINITNKVYEVNKGSSIEIELYNVLVEIKDH